MHDSALANAQAVLAGKLTSKLDSSQNDVSAQQWTEICARLTTNIYANMCNLFSTGSPRYMTPSS